MELLLHPMTELFDHCTDQFRVLTCFLALWLRLISGAYMLEINKHAR